MRVLIIDDDSDSLKLLKVMLEMEGFQVFCAHTGEKGLEHFSEIQPDLVILDVMLPDLDGRTLCWQLRLQSDIPIIMISAIAQQTEDMVEGIAQGADLYFVKPVDHNLLRVYVDRLLDRWGTLQQGQTLVSYKDDYLYVDVKQSCVRVPKGQVILTAKEFELLALLLRNIGQAISVLEILEKVWPDKAHEDKAANYVHTYVHRLRSKLEPDPSDPTYILNEYAFGYRFVKH